MLEVYSYSRESVGRKHRYEDLFTWCGRRSVPHVFINVVMTTKYTITQINCYIIIVYGYVRLHGMLKSAYRILEVFWSGDVFCLIGGVLVMRHFGRNPLVMAWLFRYINKIVFPDQNLLIFLK